MRQNLTNITHKMVTNTAPKPNKQCNKNYDIFVAKTGHTGLIVADVWLIYVHLLKYRREG
jgi:hypothetical protein